MECITNDLFTMIAGLLTLPMAMRQPGMFLSQPGIAILPSYHCPPMTVSIESAIKSRDWREKDMPGRREKAHAMLTKSDNRYILV